MARRKQDLPSVSLVPDGGKAQGQSAQGAGRCLPFSGAAAAPSPDNLAADTAAAPGAAVQPALKRQRRAYQKAVLACLQGAVPTLYDGTLPFAGEGHIRCLLLLWRRQGGKSTLLADAALMEMVRHPGRTVTYASASLLLGREIILKEAQAISEAFRIAALSAQSTLQQCDARTGAELPDLDALAEAFEQQRLELRLRRDKNTTSRTVVIAPNAATARGWSGTVLLDEFGFVPNLLELWEALEPIISTQPSFKMIGATTPPRDDAHFSYELTAPPAGAEFPINAAGNFYRSEARQLIHRVTIYDAAAAGQKIYDTDTGREITIREHFESALDRDAWRRNYNVEHIASGTSAVSIVSLKDAQTRGAGPEWLCQYQEIDSDAECQAMADWLVENLGDGRLGAGFDVAASESQSANPSSFALVERQGPLWGARLVAIWKTSDSRVSRRWMRTLITAAGKRATKKRVERLCLDSSNERLFAKDTRREFGDLVPVTLIAGNDSAENAGDEVVNMKTWLGKVLVDELIRGKGALPPHRYIYADFRRVKNDRGSFKTEVGPGGEHGDTFDAVKLALQSLTIRDDSQTAWRLVPRPQSRFQAIGAENGWTHRKGVLVV